MVSEFIDFVSGNLLHGGVLTGIGIWLYRQYKVPDKALQELGGNFYHNQSTNKPSVPSDEKKLELKAALYSGNELTRFDPEISVERELVSKIRKEIKEQKGDFLHIHIWCKLRKQGISSLLKSLNVLLSKEKSTIVLQAKEFRNQHANYDLEQFKKLTHFRIWEECKHLILLLDDAFTGEEKEKESQAKFIHNLAGLKTERLKITVISGNHDTREMTESINHELKLTIPDEEQIFKKIFKEHPVLVQGFNNNIETFLGWVRHGKNEYGEDLFLYLSLLHDFAKESGYTTENTWKNCYAMPEEFRLLSDPDEKKLITVVAAYSILESSLGDTTLINICREKRIRDWAKKLPSIVMALDQSNPDAIKLRPGQATNLLDLYSINSVEELQKEYKLAFKWDTPFIDWHYEDQELLRHLFRRLNDERYENIKIGANKPIIGSAISLPLYMEVKDSIGEYLKLCNDMAVLSSWASTLKKMRDGALMEVLINRVIEIGQTKKINTSEAFVSFASALAIYGKSIFKKVDKKTGESLIKAGLDILDFDMSFEDAKEKYEPRRFNQVITTYHSLLRQVDTLKAETFIEKYRGILDSRGLEDVGKAIDKKNFQLRLRYFKEAKEKAREQIRDFPSSYVKQMLTYMHETNCYYDGFVEDILSLIDMVGKPRNGRFSAQDIGGIQRAIDIFIKNPSDTIDELSMKKLTNFKTH